MTVGLEEGATDGSAEGIIDSVGVNDGEGEVVGAAVGNGEVVGAAVIVGLDEGVEEGVPVGWNDCDGAGDIEGT